MWWQQDPNRKRKVNLKKLDPNWQTENNQWQGYGKMYHMMALSLKFPNKVAILHVEILSRRQFPKFLKNKIYYNQISNKNYAKMNDIIYFYNDK